MINWLLGLNDLNERIQKRYLNNLKIFLIKEDLNYLEGFFKQSDWLSGDLQQINEFYIWSKVFIWYETRTFTNQLERLIEELKKTKVLLKKCLLIECELETLTLNWPNRLQSLNANRMKLYADLSDYFREIRKNCNLIDERYDELNERLFSDNQISKLPIDTFDSILDTSEFNYVKLKSLIQLIKLEISELLTLIIFYYSIDRSDLSANLKCLSSCVCNLIVDLKRFNQLIAEDCSLFTQFFIRDQDRDFVVDNRISSKQNELLFNLRSAKTKICSSLLRIDNCLSKILDENSNQIDQLNSEEIIDELTSAIDALKLIPTSPKTTTQFVHKVVQKLNADESPEPMAKEIDLNQEIPEYEVFEAYIDEDDEKLNKFIEKYEDHLFELNAKFPDSLYGELKEVLNVKAKDHRTREAKALGIDEEVLLKQQEESNVVEKRSLTKKREYDNQYFNPLPQMPFNLAKLTADHPKKINFISNEESFGDLSSDE